MKNAMELTLGEINWSPLLGGKEIRFMVEDYQGGPSGSVKEIRTEEGKTVEKDAILIALSGDEEN